MVLAIILSTLAMADTEPAGFYAANDELRSYLLEAGENNPNLHALYNQWRAALKRIPQANSLEDPVITYNYFLKSDTQTHRAALTQRFPWFGTLRARKHRTAAEAEAALERFYSARNAVFADLKRAYFEYAFLGGSIEVTRAQIELLGFTEEIVLSKYSLGVATEGDLLRVQIEETKVQDRLDTLLQLRPALSADLAENLGRSEAGPLPWPDAAGLPPDAPESQRVIRRIREANPELLALDHLIESNEKAVKLAKKKGHPNFNLGYGYTRRTDRGGEDFQMTSVGMNIPIWRKRVRAGVAEAELNERAAEYEKQGKTLSLERSAQVTLARMNDAARRFALYDDSLLPKAEQSYRSLQSAYAAGGAGADFLDLLSSVRLLLEFQLDQLRAARDLQNAAADLEKLMGGPWSSVRDAETTQN